MTGASMDIEQFLEMQAAERGAAANTIEAYRRDLGHFAQFVARLGNDLRAATPQHLSAYARQLAIEGLAPSSRARRLSAVRQLYKFLTAEAHVAEDPAHNLTGPKLARGLPKTLSVAEVDRLLDAAQRLAETASGPDRRRALRLACLVEMLYATGMRASELVSLPAGSSKATSAC